MCLLLYFFFIAFVIIDPVALWTNFFVWREENCFIKQMVCYNYYLYLLEFYQETIIRFILLWEAQRKKKKSHSCYDSRQNHESGDVKLYWDGFTHEPQICLISDINISLKHWQSVKYETLYIYGALLQVLLYFSLF